MNDQFTFANPYFLLLLVALIPLVILRARSLRFRKQAVTALVAPRLRHRLLIGNRPGTHWAGFTLQLIALALLIVALAGPRYGYTEETTIAEGRNILIGIDTSRSMLATDLQPDRLTRAKLAAHDLIHSLPGDRVGLIAFAGTSFLQAPLTVDHDAVIESISQLDTEIIPRGGTNIGRALALARETFAEAKSDSNAFILFSDGEDLESKALSTDVGPEEEPKVTVIAIGTGTTTGSIIPDPTSIKAGAFIRDRSGEIVRSRLDASGLRKLAAATGGLYLDLNSTAAMRKVVSGALERLEKSTIEGRTTRKPIDRFRWALLPALLLLLISLTPLPSQATVTTQRKTNTPSTPKEVPIRASGPDPRTPTTTATIGLTIVSLVLATPAQASPLKAWQHFQEGDFKNASSAYEGSLKKKSLHSKEELLYGAASSAYRLGDFENAIRRYGEALLSDDPVMQKHSHYGLGNALFREGETRLEGEKANPEDALAQWRNALDHYKAALTINDANEEVNEAAHFNHDLVEKRIEKLEKQQQENQDQQNQDQEGKEGDQQDQQNQKGDQSEDESQDQESKGERDQQEGEQGNQQEDQENQGDQQNEPEPAEEEDETPEGKLQAEEKPAPEQEQREQQQARAAEEVNPETGFTKSQALQILRSLADEDLDVRPLIPPSQEAVFKNW